MQPFLKVSAAFAVSGGVDAHQGSVDTNPVFYQKRHEFRQSSEDEHEAAIHPAFVGPFRTSGTVIQASL
nr:hypothetical protein [Mesorhizobium sp.]